ncbi:MAG: response regulator transcription factor [Betaproteobacteria bacterium]|nr:response regulator transcription factor [Betaproteobacteria bacterium]
MTRVLIADDHALVRDGLKRILEGNDDLTVAGEAANGHDVLLSLAAVAFDVLLLDLSMPGRSGIELIRLVRERAPRLPILVLTMHEEEQYAVRAIRAGASGYLTKDSAAAQLVSAIRKVASGGLFINAAVAEQLALNLMPASSVLPHKLLSDREFEVFRLLVTGKSITGIAQQLCLSVKTISTHKARVLQKMRLHSIADLTRYAIEHDLGD